MATEPKYGSLDDNAVRFTDTEAWLFANGEWQEINSGEAVGAARLLSKEEFEATFADDHLTALPKAAFQSGESLS